MEAAPQLELRRWREEDLPFLTRLRNDVKLQAKLLSTARGSTMGEVRAWAEARTTTAGMIFRIIEDSRLSRAVGYIQAEREAGTDEHDRSWRFGICIGDEFQGAGRGTAAISSLERLLGAERDVRNLALEVDLANRKAIACYVRLGFAETERHFRHILVCGTRRDVIRMEKTIGGEEHLG